MYKTLVTGIKSLRADEIKSELKKIDEELDGNNKNQTKSTNSFFGIPWAIAATLTVIFMSAGFWLYQSKFSQRAIVNKNYVEDPGLPVLMSSGSNKAFDEAMNHYKLGQYQHSFSAIKNLLTSDTFNDTLLYYSGVNLLKLDKSHEAVEYFRTVISEPSSEFFQDAQYRLAFCLLIEGNRGEADQIFSEIIKDSNNPYRECAKR
ncbi:MAG: hypothetical protein IPK08_19535 [Bacteroidetes bacterium]|nr:hypothetical protein [Bacteroidota bacterium]